MAQTLPAIVRVKTPRSVVSSVVPGARTQAPSLLPLLIPVSITAAAFLGKLFSRRKAPEQRVVVETRTEVLAVETRIAVVALVLRRPDN
jgi:hypothetical protein